MTERAVITGIGVVAPTGIGADVYWKATTAGQLGIGPITNFDPGERPDRYPVRCAGEVNDFDPEAFIERRLMVQMDRWTWMGLAAARLALDDAELDPAEQEPYSMGVVTGSGTGGNEFGQKEIQNLWSQGPRFVGAYQSIAWFYAATTGQLCIRHGMKGHSSVVAADGASGLEALSQAKRYVGRGLRTVLAGGAEAPVAPYAVACQLGTRRLSAAADPAKAYLPFDARANGYVPAEGGAILVVEALEAAAARGAPHRYAEIAGAAATFDAHHYADPDPSGEHLARAMQLALQRAGVAPSEVDVVFADAAGSLDADLAEAQAISSVFGDRASSVPVTAPKTMVGRLYAGAGALDVATAALALRDGVIPPTVGVDTLAAGCELDLVREARPAALSTVLVNARGFGGHNSSLVLRAVEG
jgi:minimal PKS chain-length factor (CLF/KS beta)